MLEKVLEPLQKAGWNTEYVQVGDKKILGCRACNQCFAKQDKRCVFNNDIFNEVFAKMLAADAIILGSPTYFAGVGSELKGLMDRAGYVAIANGRAFRGKIGAGVVAVRRGGATHVFDTINHMFLMSEMIVPGSLYWNMGYGLHEKDVLSDQEGLNNMRHLGETIHWLGSAIQPDRAGPPPGP